MSKAGDRLKNAALRVRVNALEARNISLQARLDAALALAENIATLHERQDVEKQDSPDGPVAVIDWYAWEALVADARKLVKEGQ